MTVKELVAVMFACVFANNYVMQNFLGVESLSIDTRRGLKGMLAMGLSVTGVLVVSSAVTWPVNAVLGEDLGYLRTFVFAIVTVAVVCVADIACSRLCKGRGREVLSVAVNSIVLGCCLMNIESGYGFLPSIMVASATGVGYLAAVFAVAGVRGRINEKFVPKSWRGAPILVAELAIISMVLFAL